MVGALFAGYVKRKGRGRWLMVCLGYRSHMVNIVTLSDGKRYMLDVGFGGYGPIRPILLDAERSTGPGIGNAATRLVKRNIPQNSDRGQELWVYEHRNDPQSEWLAMYCFSEVEFLPEDYEMMSFWTSRSRKVFFTYRVVVVKMVMEEGRWWGRWCWWAGS